MSLALVGGDVVTSLHPPRIERADIVVEGDRIVSVGAADAGAVGGAVGGAAGSTVERVDCRGCVVIPGNACAHTHVYSALARGMPYRLAPPPDFLRILQRVWWRLDRALDPATIRASALVGGLEALLAGTTTLVDHHASPEAIDGSLDIVAEALAELGIRSILCYEVTDRDGAERARAGVHENRRFLARLHRGDLPLARGMVGAHASFTLSDETLEACVAAAQDAGTGIHVHVAEDAVDERDAQARSGLRVVDRLERASALGGDSLLAHGVHVDAAEAAAIRRSGATLAHNPRSNMNNAVGRAPLALLGERVALGTDGIGADMFEESRVGYLRLREELGAGTPSDWPLARLAEGARFVGRAFDEPALGRIAPGAPADLVVLDYAAPTPLTDETLAGHWVFGLSARAVRDVVVAGRVVVGDRRVALVDGDRVVAEARLEAARLWERLATIDAHPFEPRGVAVR